MKVLHVVTLASSRQDFGGPAVVAINQCKSLSKLGIETTLLSLSDEATKRTSISFNEKFQYEHVCFKNINRFSRQRFHLAFNLNLVIWFCKNAKKFDLVHLHLSRDFVTTIIGLISTFMMIPIIVQSHGMVAEGKSVPKRVFDLMLSKRIMHKARKIYVLSDAEFRKTISRYGIKSSMISQIQNGALNTSSILNRTSHNHTVVWIGRLQRHKRPELFVEIAKSAANIFKELVFIIVGPDGGVKHKVLDSINRMNLTNIKVLEPLNNDEVYALLSSSAILINTSISELNPMVVVEALSVGTPVIINDACEAKGMIANSRSGMVIKGHPDEYIKAIDVVLKDWFQYSENARELFLNSLTIDAVAAKISKDYVFIASNKIGKH